MTQHLHVTDVKRHYGKVIDLKPHGYLFAEGETHHKFYQNNIDYLKANAMFSLMTSIIIKA